MKIKEHHDTCIDITELYLKFKDEYTDVFMFQFENQVFLYRQLGRRDYKELLELDVSDFQKEEILCKTCVLFPEDYDFEECDAGIPTQLSKVILNNSFLDSLDSRELVISVFRKEMYELDNQITCLIHEAFPEYKIEEIETWDLQRTAKYLSRAEWILANLRGAVFSHDPFTGKTPEQILAEQETSATTVSTTELTDEKDTFIANGGVETIEERQERLKNKKMKKEKMTPEKLNELRAKYPDMEWGSNVFDELTVEDMKDSVSVISPALRPGW